MRVSLPVAAAAFLLAVVPPALAHAYLKNSSPAAGAVTKAGTSTLLLMFTEAVQPKFCRVTVTNGKGQRAETGAPELVSGHANELSVPVHFPAAGRYVVTWHALSTDTHKTTGSYSFTVSP